EREEVVTTQPIKWQLASTASARTKMTRPMMTDSQSSLIRGAVSLALQDARGEAVSMGDMMVLLRQRATAARSRPPSLRDSLSLNASARGGIFHFVSAYCYNIFLF